MPALSDLVRRVWSKNAGPFWVTVDIFCGDAAVYRRISHGLATGDVATVLGVPAQTLRRFDIPDLHVVKLSLPRAVVQGDRADRDMHGAQLAHLVGEIVIAD